MIGRQLRALSGGYEFTISADGNIVGVNLHQEGIYVKNMLTGNVQRVDVTADGQTSSDTGNWGTSIIVSPDGNYVAFTGSNDLVPGQPSGGPQLC